MIGFSFILFGLDKDMIRYDWFERQRAELCDISTPIHFTRYCKIQ